MITENTLLVLVVIYLLSIFTSFIAYLSHLFYRYVAGVDPPKEARHQARVLDAILESVNPLRPMSRTWIGNDEKPPPS